MTSELGGRVVAGSGVAPFELGDHNCFACGSLNEHGMRLVIHVEPSRSWTDLTLTERFEGWAGIAHGGILATILDEVMAWALVGQDNWGLTARMNVEFKRPVPIGVPIHAEGEVTRNRRRLIETSGRVIDAATGEVLATATGTYLAAAPERRRELEARYGFRYVDDAERAPDAVGTR